MPSCTRRARCLAALLLVLSSGLSTSTIFAQSLSESDASSTPRGHLIVLKSEPLSARSSTSSSEARTYSPRSPEAVLASATALRDEQQRVIEAIEAMNAAYGISRGASQIKRQWSLALNAIKVDELTAEQIATIEAMPEVVGIFEDSVVSAIPEQQTGSGFVFDASEPAFSRNPGLTGRGVSIGVLDSGINWNHPDLGGCFGLGCTVVGGIDVANGDKHPMDDYGHGTSVSSRIAGRGLSRGLARGAQLHAIKVLDHNGNGLISTVVDGIEYAMDPNGDCCDPSTQFCNFTPSCTTDRLDIINLSVNVAGGSMDDPLSSAVNRAVDLGIVAIAAAGNSGPTISSIGSPGAAKLAITVGAYDEESGTVASTSGRGPAISRFSDRATRKPDLVARGVNVCAASFRAVAPGVGGTCDRSRRHTLVSGTSQAAPEVAAAAALILEQRPEWTPSQIKKYLTTSAVSLGVSAMRQGAGRLDISDLYAPASTPAEVAPLRAIIQFQCRNLLCRFSASASPSTQSIRRITWATTNGRVRDSAVATFRYPEAGTYSISLRIIDTSGRVARNRMTFSVSTATVRP